jgi:hypothetical protein
MTYEEMRANYKSDEQLARVLFAMLTIQEAKLARQEPQAANQPNYKRRENRA